MAPSLSTGSSSAQPTPDMSLHDMHGLHNDQFNANTKAQMTTHHFLSSDANRRQFGTVDSFKHPFDVNFRPTNYHSQPDVHGFSPLATTFESTTGAHYQSILDDTNNKWAPEMLLSEAKDLNMSLAGPLSLGSSSAYQGSTYTSFDSMPPGILTPASAFDSASAPGSACGSHFDLSSTEGSMSYMVPSQAFLDEPLMSQDMDYHYGTESSHSTPMQGNHGTYMSPFAGSSVSLGTPIKHMSDFKLGSSSSPLSAVKPLPSSRAGHTAAGRARDRKRVTKVKVEGKLFKGELVDYVIEDGLDLVNGTCHKDGPETKRHTCFMITHDGQECRRKFQRNEHLKRHQDMHSDIKAFGCLYPECMNKKDDNKPFAVSRKDNWVQHVATHVKADIQNPQAGNGVRKTSSKHRNFPRSPVGTQELLLHMLPRKEALAKLASIQTALRRQLGKDPATGEARDIFPALLERVQ